MMAENEQVKIRVRKAGYVISMGLILLIIGSIISSQTVKHIEAKKSRMPETRQLEQLVLLLKETENKKFKMEKQLQKMRQQVHDMGKSSLPPSLSSPQLQKLYQIAGITSVKGPGIQIRLEDASTMDKLAYSQNFGQDTSLVNNDGLIHSDDVLKIINELKAAGATAVSVNNQRIVTTSEVVTAGSSIIVNQTRVLPPYLIKAVGPADTMVASIKMRGGIVEFLEAFGIRVNISRKTDISIMPYTGSL